MRSARFPLAVLLAAALAGCAGDAGLTQALGTGLGAGVGAVAGGAVGSHIGGSVAKTVSTFAGAAVGGYLGSKVAAGMTARDRSLASGAEARTLERTPSGSPVAWRNPDTGRGGEVTAEPARFAADGQPCRPFRHALAGPDGAAEAVEAVACRSGDGTWRVVAR